jgi:hypothetical protein
MTCPTCTWSGRERCLRRDCPIRAWWLEFDCDGVPVTWRGNAASERDAEQRARDELSHRVDAFNGTGARLVACLER